MIDLCLVCVSYIAPKSYSGYNGVKFQPAQDVAPYQIYRLTPVMLAAIGGSEPGTDGMFYSLDGSQLPMRAVVTIRGSRYCEIHIPALPNGYTDRTRGDRL